MFATPTRLSCPIARLGVLWPLTKCGTARPDSSSAVGGPGAVTMTFGTAAPRAATEAAAELSKAPNTNARIASGFISLVSGSVALLVHKGGPCIASLAGFSYFP